MIYELENCSFNFGSWLWGVSKVAATRGRGRGDRANRIAAHSRSTFWPRSGVSWSETLDSTGPAAATTTARSRLEDASASKDRKNRWRHSEMSSGGRV